MTIERYEQTVIPQTEHGRKFAKEYVIRLKMQGSYLGIVENANEIIIRAKYDVSVIEEKGGN